MLKLICIFFLSITLSSCADDPYVSPKGFIRHAFTGRNLRASTAACPKSGDTVRFGSTANEEYMKFRFVQAEGHFGYIEHHCGNVWFQPRYGEREFNHPDNTDLVMTAERHHGANFYFDEENNRIYHRGGKAFYPSGGSITPNENDVVKIHGSYSEASGFIFVPESGSGSVYPKPQLGGRWEVLFAVLTPISQHTYTIKYKIGKSVMKQETKQVSFKISSSAAKDWFSSDAEYSYLASITDTYTWDYEINRSYQVDVEPGTTSVTWQFVFEASRLGETLYFKSSILHDTDDINKPPNITPGTLPKVY